MANNSPDLIRQVEAESVDTPEFNSLLNDVCCAAIDAHACGNDFGTGRKRGEAESALIDHIDNRDAARLVAARQECHESQRELIRRLYVELFHCHQQMIATTDENDEPLWLAGVTVPAVLADAKAVLEDQRRMAGAARQGGITNALTLYEFSAFENGERQQYVLLADLRALLATQSASTAPAEHKPRWDEAEFNAMVEKGTKAWAGVEFTDDREIVDISASTKPLILNENHAQKECISASTAPGQAEGQDQ